MAFDRRQILALPTGLVLAALWPLAKSRAESTETMLASGFASTNRLFGTATLSPSGDEWPLWTNPVRLHQVLPRPQSSQLLAIARRPGRIIAILERDGESAPRIIEAGPARHFSGHGAFSRDGRYLFTTENAYKDGKGVIAVRDVDRNYDQVDEWSSFGVGPHDILLSPDARQLIVANGGIRTHPDSGRTKLNLESMQPSIATINAASGELEQLTSLPSELHQLSIRHLAQTPDGRVVFAMQDEAKPRRARPLAGVLGREGALQLLEAPAEALDGLQGYVGSIAIESGGNHVAVSSPRGGRLALWDLRSRRFAGQVDLPDVCGLAAAGQEGEFLVTNGFGEIARLAITDAGPQLLDRVATRYRWDNHLTLIAGG